MAVIREFQTGKLSERTAYARLYNVVAERIVDVESADFKRVYEAYANFVTEYVRRHEAEQAKADPIGTVGAEPAEKPSHEVESAITAGAPRDGAPADVEDLYHTRTVDEELKLLRASDRIRFAELPVDVQRTQRRIASFSQDWKKTEAFVLTAAGRPELPFSEWKNLIRGKFVNLDAVITAQNAHQVTDREGKEVAEGVELIFHEGQPVITKEVRNLSDWILAFEPMRDAITFLFPWRAEELQFWYKHIIRTFRSIVPSAHYYVVLYERSVRNRLAASNNFRLSDMHEFEDLHTQYIGPAAALAKREDLEVRTVGPKRNRPRTAGVSEACCNWNWTECTVEGCRYTHKCARCGRRGHKGKDDAACSAARSRN
jgi:hypothetical protein